MSIQNMLALSKRVDAMYDELSK